MTVKIVGEGTVVAGAVVSVGEGIVVEVVGEGIVVTEIGSEEVDPVSVLVEVELGLMGDFFEEAPIASVSLVGDFFGEEPITSVSLVGDFFGEAPIASVSLLYAMKGDPKASEEVGWKGEALGSRPFFTSEVE